MCFPFSAITNRTRHRNPSMALLITAVSLTAVINNAIDGFNVQLNGKLRLLASRVNIINIFQRGHLPLWGLILQSYYHVKKDSLAFRHCCVTMSIERPITKKSNVTCKKTFERTL